MRPAAAQTAGGRGAAGGARAPVPALATVRALHAAGARIVAGTDSPLVPYGISLHGELEDYEVAARIRTP
jgi:imidazolonepropionase-like amidohydrolase